MATTGRSLITKALQKARVLTKHETPSADEISDGLSDLNNLVASWANDTLLAFSRTSESFSISSGVGSYTIGSGATFNTVRPTIIVSAFVRFGGTDYPLEIIDGTEYDNSESEKDTPGYPRRLLYEAGNPTGTITLFPYPNAAGTLHLRKEAPLTAFTLDGEVDLPPGWDRALIHNLAVEIAPDYGLEVPKTTMEIAAKSKDNIKLNTARNRKWTTPPLVDGGSSNILSGPV